MLACALLCASAAALVAAEPYITSPVASSRWRGGQPVRVAYTDTSAAPRIDLFAGSRIDLCTGTATQQACVFQIANPWGVADPTVHGINTTIPPNVGANGRYFVRIQSLDGKDAAGQPLQAFSAQFQMTAMTGTMPALAAVPAGEGYVAPTATGGSARSRASGRASGSATRTSSRAAGGGAAVGAPSTSTTVVPPAGNSVLAIASLPSGATVPPSSAAVALPRPLAAILAFGLAALLGWSLHYA